VTLEQELFVLVLRHFGRNPVYLRGRHLVIVEVLVERIHSVEAEHLDAVGEIDCVKAALEESSLNRLVVVHEFVGRDIAEEGFPHLGVVFYAESSIRGLVVIHYIVVADDRVDRRVWEVCLNSVENELDCVERERPVSRWLAIFSCQIVSNEVSNCKDSVELRPKSIVFIKSLLKNYVQQQRGRFIARQRQGVRSRIDIQVHVVDQQEVLG
jgi:hypothetical protein